MNKIVARFADGKIIKGFTSDFSPGKPMFHLTSRIDRKTEVVVVNKLKAVFIVKEFEGDPAHREASDFDDSQNVYGDKLKVHFRDGEILVGIGMGYSPEKPGFFMTPCDPRSNTIRAFVINDFVDRVERL